MHKPENEAAVSQPFCISSCSWSSTSLVPRLLPSFLHREEPGYEGINYKDYLYVHDCTSVMIATFSTPSFWLLMQVCLS